MGYLEVFCFLMFLVHSVHTKGLVLQFSWTKINFTWPDNGKINNGPENNPDAYDSYIYENNVPMGSNKWKNKVFVSIPRRQIGVPSTLNYVWLNQTQRHNVPLIPYPDWSTNRMNTNNDTNVHLVSTYRMVVDVCDRLWVIDDGRIESFGPSGSIHRIQNPSVVIINLHTDEIIRQYFFKDSDLSPLSSLVNIAVDVERSSCDDAYAYIPDTLGFGLVVYSFLKNESWRVKHKYFYIESLTDDFYIAGLKFFWYDGIFSIGLSEKNEDGFKTAYFNPMAGTHLYSVSTKVLKSKELATRSNHGTDIKVLFNKGRHTQSSASDIHPASGTMFFSLVNKNALGCWNTNYRKRASLVDVIYKNDKTFIYPSDLKVTQDEVIVVSNRFPIYDYQTLDYNDTNFRIWITEVYNATINSVCYRKKHHSN